MENIESHSPEIQKVEKFFSFEHPYEIQIGQNEGELNLSQIASQVEQEYCWAFDEKTSTWHYYPPEKHSEKVSRFKGEAEFKARIPKELFTAPSDSSVFYHIHSDSLVDRLLPKLKKRWQNREFLMVSNQLPSRDDIANTIKLEGYKEFRIVTSNGTTVYEFHPERMDSKEGKFSTLSIPRKELCEALNISFEEAVKKALDYMNEHYQGVFTFSFKKLNT